MKKVLIIHSLKMKFIAPILLLSLSSMILCQRSSRSNSLGNGGRIVGGENIWIEEAPYQASLMYFGYHICGGAILSKKYIITAAHCKLAT